MSIVFPNFFTYFCDILHNYDTFPCIQLIFQPEPFAEYRGSSRTHVRLGAWFWSAKADIFFSESLHIYTSFRSAQNHCLPDNVRPRGAFISVGDCTPTEKDLLLLTTCRSGSLLDWDKSVFSLTLSAVFGILIHTIRNGLIYAPNVQKHCNNFWISKVSTLKFKNFYFQHFLRWNA